MIHNTALRAITLTAAVITFCVLSTFMLLTGQELTGIYRYTAVTLWVIFGAFILSTVAWYMNYDWTQE
jgi:hypothetical protein